MSTKPTLLSTIALSFALQATATAQVSEPARGSSEARGTLEEVTVTAQRRAENVLDVPLSISAITAEALESTGIDSFTDLRFNTPGYLTSTGSGYTQIFIRGIGNRIQIGADPSVSTFVDDTPRIYSSLVDDLSNVERIEVLKGAQGGLYGRNATAGVINVITRQPDPGAFAADARVGYGMKDTFDATAYLNIPLSENLAMNFTVTRKSHDDYIDNQAIRNPYASYAALSPEQAAALGDTGQRAYLLANPGRVAALDSVAEVSHLSNQDYLYVDGKILLRGDGFQVRLAGDWSDKDDANGNAWKSVQLSRTYGTYTALMNAFGNGQARLPFAYLYPQSGKFGEFEAGGPIHSYARLKDYGASAKADVDMPGFTLTSISSFRWNESLFRNDVTGSTVPSAGFLAGFDRRNFYQELRAVSSDTEPFRWLAGATYYWEEIDNSVATILLGNTLAPTTDVTGTNALSYYFQGEYDITDRLKIIASGRYIDEVKSADYPAGVVAIYDPVTDRVINGVPVAAASGDFDTSKFVPAVTISHALDGGGTVYVRWANGLKTGGANPLVHPAQTLGEPNALGPEEVDSYEVGLRTNLFDRKVQFTSAIFYNDYTDLQVLKSGYTGLAAAYFNAGKARTYGAEVSVNWRVSDFFSLGANLGYLDAEYTDFNSPGIPQLKVAPFDVSGKRMILSPEWQGGITADFNVPITNSINGVATVLYSYSSRFFTDDMNEPLAAQEAYSLVNLRVGAKTSNERIGVYLTVDNAFDEEYITWGSVAPSAYSVQLGPPRIVMGEVQVKF